MNDLMLDGLVHPAIASAIASLPNAISERSGAVFYSGHEAFRGKRHLYILGLNPGGSPVRQSEQTAASDLAEWAAPERSNWSAYVDAAWSGRPAGSHGIQPRMRHMFDRLDLDLRQVPASNVVFVRTPDERALATEKSQLLSDCWPVHQAVIDTMNIRIVLALGNTAGRWVRDAIGAHGEVARFEESNEHCQRERCFRQMLIQLPKIGDEQAAPDTRQSGAGLSR